MWDDYYITFAVYALIYIRNILKTIKRDSKYFVSQVVNLLFGYYLYK